MLKTVDLSTEDMLRIQLAQSHVAKAEIELALANQTQQIVVQTIQTKLGGTIKKIEGSKATLELFEVAQVPPAQSDPDVYAIADTPKSAE